MARHRPGFDDPVKVCVTRTFGQPLDNPNVSDRPNELTWIYNQNTTNLRYLAGSNDTYPRMGIDAYVTYRLKTPASTINKLLRNKIGFHKLNDLIGYRVITKTIAECYRVMTILERVYHVHEKHDYIREPKENNYESIHLLVQIPSINHIVEIQIRTQGMNDYWEYEHVMYKQGEGVKSLDDPALDFAPVSNVLKRADDLYKSFAWTPKEFLAYEASIEVLWWTFEEYVCAREVDACAGGPSIVCYLCGRRDAVTMDVYNLTMVHD